MPDIVCMRVQLTLAEDVHKVGHGVVVNTVQGVQGVDEEVSEGASGGHRPIDLPGLADGHLRLLGQLHLLRDVRRRPLGLLQILNELNVLQNVSLKGT